MLIQTVQLINLKLFVSDYLQANIALIHLIITPVDSYVARAN